MAIILKICHLFGKFYTCYVINANNKFALVFYLIPASNLFILECSSEPSRIQFVTSFSTIYNFKKLDKISKCLRRRAF